LVEARVKLISFSFGGREGFGTLFGDEVADLSSAAIPDLKTALAAGLPASAARTLKMADVNLLPPIPNPGKIFCVGLNYVEHREETGRAATAHPTIFTRFADTQVGHDAPLICPRESEKFDFEGELAVIIGKAGRRIFEAEALAHVAGYACYNDGSIRDWQNHTAQFTPGKNFPGTGGFGPWMVTADELPDPTVMNVTTRLNGQVVQHAPVSDMIFSIPRIIAYLSAFTMLSPGDVISTGTPGGVGAKRVPPLWMKSGDVVEVEISGIGVLRNPVIADR
jgi:2-keto-4-pentenoate hydratase/2-oxohepta-3-ene-1,7-dioic acid hydratase in catechol pathway